MIQKVKQFEELDDFGLKKKKASIYWFIFSFTIQLLVYFTQTFLFLPFQYFMFTLLTTKAWSHTYICLRSLCNTTLFVTHPAFIVKWFLYCFEDICSSEAQTADEVAEDKTCRQRGSLIMTPSRDLSFMNERHCSLTRSVTD